MPLISVLRLFQPKDRVFNELFQRSADNVSAMSELLAKAMGLPAGTERAELIRKLEAGEHKNDEITHEIFTQLARNFITPFDREDIHGLASALDDIADYIYASAKKLSLYHIEQGDEVCVELSQLVIAGSKEVRKAVEVLKDLSRQRPGNAFLVRINSIENEADEVFDRGIQQLFADGHDAIHVIKMKDLYSMLEIATDKCEDVANILESIVLKYA